VSAHILNNRTGPFAGAHDRFGLRFDRAGELDAQKQQFGKLNRIYLYLKYCGHYYKVTYGKRWDFPKFDLFNRLMVFHDRDSCSPGISAATFGSKADRADGSGKNGQEVILKSLLKWR